MMWTDILAIALAVGGVILLIHHGIVHYLEGPDCSAQKESVIWVGYFQIKDVAHYETWLVVCWTNAVSLGLLGGVVRLYAVCLLCFVSLCLLVVICGEGGFNLQHIHNHETWVVVCFTNAVTLVVS